MGEQNNINVNIATNAQQAAAQVDQFNLALGRVDQQARRIFSALQELSQRYQQQGFLGLADQRTLERGIQQWERMSQTLELRRRGAAARLQDVEARAGVIRTPMDIARVGQAAGVLRRLTLHQESLATLEGQVAPVFGGPLPASPLQAAQMAAGGRVTPFAAGRFGVWPGGTPAPTVPPVRPISQAQLAQQVASLFGFGPGAGQRTGGLTPAQLAAQAFGLVGGGGLPPGRPPLPPGLTPPSGPFSNWPGTFGQRAMGYAGMAAQHAGQAFALTPGQVGGAALAVGGRLGGMAGGLAGLAIGYTGYQLVNQSMQAFETRSQGVLAVGRLLEGQYQDIDTSLQTLRRDYFILARDAAAAMMIVGRATGQALPGFVRNQVVGRAYGMSPQETATVQATLARGGLDRVPDLTGLVGIHAQTTAQGLTRLPFPTFAEEAARASTVGGLGFAPMSTTQAGRFTQLMGAFGGRFADFPAQAFEQFTAGMAGPKPPLGQALAWQAVEDVSRTHPTLRYGGRTLDLRGSYTDRLMAIENAAHIPEMIAGFQRVAQRTGVGNTDLTRLISQQMFSTPNMYATAQVSEGLQMVAGQPGGIAGALTEPAPVALGERRVAQLRAQQSTDAAAREGLMLERYRAQLEVGGEAELIKKLMHVRESFVDAFATGAEALQKNTGFVNAMSQALERINPQILEWGSFMLVAAGALASAVPGGAVVGVPMLLGGGLGGAGATWRTQTTGVGVEPAPPTQPRAPQP